MAQEQDVAALNQARDAQCVLEAARQKNTEDVAKLERAISAAMSKISVSLGPVTPESLVEEVWCLPDVARDLDVDAKCALGTNHTASRKSLASHAQRESDVPVNFS
jgi:hypothetical protein